MPPNRGANIDCIDWDAYLDELEAAIEHRVDLIDAAVNLAETDGYRDREVTSTVPSAVPTPRQRTRATAIRARLDLQEQQLNAALILVADNIERVEQLQAAQLSRNVAEINAGGFEARA